MPCSRVWSILVTNFAIVIFWVSAIFFSSIQKGSSRLKLVLCPPTVMERFTTEDFITPQRPRNAVEGAIVASFLQFTKARAATTRGESVGGAPSRSPQVRSVWSADLLHLGKSGLGHWYRCWRSCRSRAACAIDATAAPAPASAWPNVRRACAAAQCVCLKRAMGSSQRGRPFDISISRISTRIGLLVMASTSNSADRHFSAADHARCDRWRGQIVSYLFVQTLR